MKLAGVVIAAIIVLAGCDAGEMAAYSEAKDRVTSMLRSPSTAEWPTRAERQEHTWSLGTDGDSTLEVLGGERYRISSWVDAQNGFGGTARAYWVADATRYGNDWSVIIHHFGNERVSVSEAIYD